jgi:hypothetical protein
MEDVDAAMGPKLRTPGAPRRFSATAVAGEGSMADECKDLVNSKAFFGRPGTPGSALLKWR